MEIPYVNATEEIVQRPPCRCEFVLKWLDEHLQYFPRAPAQEPKLITRLCAYTYGPPNEHFYYSAPVNSARPDTNIQLPFIVLAPHRISPLRPQYH